MEIITEAQRWAQALKPGLKCHKKKKTQKNKRLQKGVTRRLVLNKLATVNNIKKVPEKSSNY